MKLMGRKFEGVWLIDCVIGGGGVLVIKVFEREGCLGCGRNYVTNGRDIDRILATGSMSTDGSIFSERLG